MVIDFAAEMYGFNWWINEWNDAEKVASEYRSANKYYLTTVPVVVLWICWLILVWSD